MIRLLHLADVHLGRTFKMLGERGAAQRRALQDALERAVTEAIQRQVSVVLIAGDLFDSPRPSDALVQFAGRQLRRLEEAGILTVLIAGNHDVASDGFVGGADRLRAHAARLVLAGPDPLVHVSAELDLTIVARSATPDAATSPLGGWPPGRATRFAVGVAHGSTYRAGQVEGPHVIHPGQIRDLGLDYLALGDWHSAFEVTPPPACCWYAGAPEWLQLDQPGVGQVLLVEIPAPGAAQVTPLQVGRRRYARREIDVAGLDEAALREAIARLADPDLVLEADLVGIVPLASNLHAAEVERDLADRFFRLRVRNRTHLWVDESALDEFPAQTVLGRFIRVMRDRIAAAAEDDRPALEEALQVGVALLQGREEVLV